MILVFGSINLDLIFPLPHLPAPGQTVLGPATRIEPGGKGANQAVAAARDRARVVMAGAVGHDSLADTALAGLKEADVDLARVARVNGGTGCAGIAVDPNGQNMVVVGAGANLLARADQVEDALLGPDTTVVLQMECDPGETAALIRRARAAKCRIILNLAPAGKLADDALRAVDLVVTNGDEAAWLGEHLGTGTNAASLCAALGVGVIVTRSAQGVEGSFPGLRHLQVGAHQVEPRDTTGAGDCFVGVLAAALDHGDTIQAAMRRANLAAALSCTALGTQGSLPTRRQIEAALPDSPVPTTAEPRTPV